MAFWKVFCTACAAAGAVCVCVATAGTATPLVASTVIGWGAGAGTLGYLVGDKADKEATEREKTLMQDKRYKDAKEAEDKQVQENNKNKNLVDEIAGKLNGKIPRQQNETDEYLKQQFVIAQGNLKNGENRLNHLRNDADKLRKELGGNTSLMSLLGLNKLSFTDKVLIAGGIVLIIFLLKK